MSDINSKEDRKTAVPASPVQTIVRLRHYGRADKYSLNLYKFLKKKGEYYWNIYFCPRNVITGENDIEYATDKTIASNLFIGFVDDDGYLMGAKLSTIICNGAKTQTFAYPPNDFKPVPDFWVRYVEHGKCAIDPEHELYFEKERYETAGSLRACKWCGRVERMRIVERVVKDEVWELAPAT